MTLESDKRRHMSARNRDHLMIPFQCDLWHYRNLKKMDIGDKEDITLLRVIRRENLETF